MCGFFLVGVIVGRTVASGEQQVVQALNKIDENKKSDLSFQSWNLMLVNQDHPILDDFFVNLVETEQKFQIDERVKEPLENMLQDMRAEGLNPRICSAYRSHEKQENLFQNKINTLKNQGYSLKEAEEEAAKWVAIPGTSEHQLGLAVDLVATSNQKLDESQEQTKEQQWLMKNCYKYGFILRYPSDKSHITKIGYEPWHYRYVGVEVATELTTKGLCLEEYINN